MKKVCTYPILIVLLFLITPQNPKFSVSLVAAQEQSKGQESLNNKKDKGSPSKQKRATSKFIYQADSGECLDSKGEKGFNIIDLKYLFDGLHESDLSSPNYQPKPVYLNKNAECTDFSNFDFNRIIKLSYVRLEKWNLKGSKLDGAAFAFAKMLDADLQGAKLSSISIGYTSITGKVDRFTEYPKVCTLERKTRLSTDSYIKCEL